MDQDRTPFSAGEPGRDSAPGPPPAEAGDFIRVYEEFKLPVYKLACRLTGNAAEAEDLFQETWVKAVASFRERGIRPESARAWVFTIAVNLHRDMLRKKRLRRRLHGEATGTDGAEERGAERVWGSSPATGDEALERREFRRTLDLALARLPENQRRVFVLKGFEGYTHAEVGRLLRIREATVKTLFFRAVRKLRAELRPALAGLAHKGSCPAIPSGERGAGSKGACPAIPSGERGAGSKGACPAIPSGERGAGSKGACPAIPSGERGAGSKGACPAIPSGERGAGTKSA
ncbi:MAG: RNA polymerase sigma factor [Candidatus Aminicenantes bacterium]|nr:RNA polymerase sigma factor [Candidatus Aminicenantes bacterium]